jgi:hypothetical protein
MRYVHIHVSTVCFFYSRIEHCSFIAEKVSTGVFRDNCGGRDGDY